MRSVSRDRQVFNELPVYRDVLSVTIQEREANPAICRPAGYDVVMEFSDGIGPRWHTLEYHTYELAASAANRVLVSGKFNFGVTPTTGTIKVTR